MTEAQITKMMKSLGVSREEAIQCLKDDEAIDKGEKLFELTPEQKKASKEATITTGDKRKRAYTFTKRERKPDLVKREIIETLAQNVDRAFFDDQRITDIQIIKPEKEISFHLGEDVYSITLTKHRKPKGE